MLQEFQRRLSVERLLEPGASVIIAFSGGPDSSCLLHLLTLSGCDVTAAHLVHGLREEAEREAELCRAFALKHGARFEKGCADVRAIAEQDGIGLEEAGRKARYSFFAAVHKEIGAPVATAHTLDDHVETILMNLARGSGARGLSGIPMRRDYVIRPLLWVRRSETQEYCREHGLLMLSDPANEDLQFARNRVRKFVIPGFEQIRSGAVEAAVRSARILSEEDALLDALAEDALAACMRRRGGALDFVCDGLYLELRVEPLKAAPTALLRRVVRIAARRFDVDLDWTLTDIVTTAIQSGEKASVAVEGAPVRVLVGERTLRVVRDEATVDFEVAVEAGGSVPLPRLGGRLGAGVLPGEMLPDGSRLTAWLDADSIIGTLVVRAARSEDELVPVGDIRRRRAFELLENAGLPLKARRRCPIVCDDEGPVWVPECATASRVQVTPATKRTLRLRLEPDSTDGTV